MAKLPKASCTRKNDLISVHSIAHSQPTVEASNPGCGKLRGVGTQSLELSGHYTKDGGISR